MWKRLFLGDIHRLADNVTDLPRMGSEVKKIDRQKYQEVKIIYNFVGEILDISK